MAITTDSATSWADIKSYLENLTDENGNNYFTNVVIDVSTSRLQVFTTESGQSPLCELQMNGNYLYLYYDDNGTVRTKRGSYTYTGGSTSFPVFMYKATWGCLINFPQNNPFQFGFCKTKTGKVGVLISPNATSIAQITSSLSIGLHTFDDVYSSDPFYIQISGINENISSRAYTALLPIPAGSKTPDYSKNVYVNMFDQYARNSFGSFEYDGHWYLTNGLVSILDT